MARSIGEFIPGRAPELRPEVSVAVALNVLLSQEHDVAPVVDERRRPLGLVSLADVLGKRHGSTVAERMTRQIVTLPATTPVHVAMRIGARAGDRPLLVVDHRGRVIGLITTTDLLRAGVTDHG